MKRGVQSVRVPPINNTGLPDSNPNAISSYPGVTKNTIKSEGYRWLTLSGANENLAPGQKHSGSRNRPSLLWEDGSTITQAEARAMGFDSQFVYFNKLRRNCRLVEDAIQEQIESIESIPKGLGKRLGNKLFRHVAMGGRDEDPEQKEDSYLCKVFITWIPRAKLLKAGVKVNL